MKPVQPNELTDSVKKTLSAYLAQLGDQPATDIYNMVTRHVEKAMLEWVLEETAGNQQNNVNDNQEHNRGDSLDGFRNHGNNAGESQSIGKCQTGSYDNEKSADSLGTFQKAGL